MSIKNGNKHIEEALQKIISYLSDNAKAYVAHILALVKSYWLQAKLAPLSARMAVNYTENDFSQYREEAEPQAEEIIKSL